MRRFVESMMGRRAVVWGVFSLALVLLVASSLSVWVKRQALDTPSWTDASVRLLQDDEVRALVAADLADAVVQNSGIREQVARALPPRLSFFAPAAAGVLREAAVSGADQLLQRPEVIALWERANRETHRRLVTVLEGGDDPLVQANGDVAIDLRPLVQRLAARLGVSVTLPPGAGVYTVMKADQLETYQDAVSTIRRVSILLFLLVVALFAAAVYLARGFRRRVVGAISLGLVGAGVLLLVVRRVVGDELVSSLTSPSTEEAGSRIWLIGTELLRDLAIALMLYGVALAVAVWIGGASRLAVRLRGLLAAPMRDHPVAVYGVVAVLVLLFLASLPDAGGRRIVGALVFCALVVVGVEALRRQIAKESAPGAG